jgi:ribosomal protein S18 acetylase RimI-like enzyme
VRAARAEDHAGLRRLINDAYLVERFFVDGERLAADELEALARRGTFLVGEDPTGALVACVYVEIRGARACFGPLAVDPRCQGEGWGTRMVDAAEAEARAHGCEAIDITVASLRTELPPFYRRLGYEQTGTRPFTDPRKLRDCHFIVMSKALR